MTAGCDQPHRDPHVRARVEVLRRAARGELGPAGRLVLAAQLGPVRPAIPATAAPDAPPASGIRLSRYPLPVEPGRDPVDVGWDAAAGSFYAQVWGPDDDAPPRHQLGGGGRYGVVRTVAELRAALAPHAQLPAGIGAILLADQQECGDWTAAPAPTPATPCSAGEPDHLAAGA
jgi:hypothetical protein